MKTLIFLCFLSFTPLFALSFGVPTLFLKGTIGKSPIVMEFEIEGGEIVYGNYFYLKTGLNIPFEGVTLEKKFSFHAGSHFKNDEEKELFVLDRSGNVFTGKWTFNGKTLPVKLELISRSDIKHPYTINPFFSGDDYGNLDYFRSSLAEFKRLDSITVVDGISLQWFRETHSGIENFRVIKGLPMDQIMFVNNYMEAIQLEAFTSYGSCSFGEADPEYSADVSSLFINKDFLSFAMSYGYYCGGAHPDFSVNFHNLDLKGKKALDTDEILQFKGVVMQEDNYSLWTIYRETTYGPIINEALKVAYPDYFFEDDPETDEDDIEGCNYNDPYLWEFSDVLITSTGLQFNAYFARYMRSCDSPEWAILSYKDLQEFLNPAYREALLKIEE